MPGKGFITQALALLLRNPLPLQEIEERLGEFKIARRAEASAPGGPSALVAYRPVVNGYVLIDVVDGRWPDRMGDPKEAPEVFAAWAAGDFGPGAWPGGLERACLQSLVWPEGRSVPLQHQSFIRIRCSYVYGAGPEAPLMPSDYRPLQELEFLTRIAAALVCLPEVICYFNPNGECVRDARGFAESLSYHASAKLMPLELWSNIRLFKLNDMQPEWSFMDTVGMSQLDAPDHEACYQSGAYEPAEVGNFLRNASAYVVEHDGRTGQGEVAGIYDQAGPHYTAAPGHSLASARSPNAAHRIDGHLRRINGICCPQVIDFEVITNSPLVRKSED